MLSKEQVTKYQEAAARRIQEAGIYLSPEESRNIEVADFGLSDFETTGLGVHVYVNTERCCAKELAMWPGQTCPQHRHPDVDGQPGKEETFRVRSGTVYLYVSGDPTDNIKARMPDASDGSYSVFREIILNRGDQYTLAPDTWHWFQAGPEGAVVSEFSTRSTDEYDIFSDPAIARETTVLD